VLGAGGELKAAEDFFEFAKSASSPFYRHTITASLGGTFRPRAWFSANFWGNDLGAASSRSIRPAASWPRPPMGGSVTSSLRSPVIVLRTVHDRLGDLHRFVDTHLFDNLAGDGLDTVVSMSKWPPSAARCFKSYSSICSSALACASLAYGEGLASAVAVWGLLKIGQRLTMVSGEAHSTRCLSVSPARHAWTASRCLSP
jgi:hypothetical protein